MKFLSENNITNKTVILRCDLNVTIKDRKIIDTTKIDKSMMTINHLIKNNNKIIILSHLGRIKSKEDKQKYSLKLVYDYLKKYYDIEFIEDYEEFDINNYNSNIFLFENTRFYDYPLKKESNCNIEFAKDYAKFGDVFVMDAFAVSHRKHATVLGLSMIMDTYIGLLMEEEIKNLDYILNTDKKLLVVMGGAKVDDKIPLIKTLAAKCDKLVITGGILNSFLKAKGYNIGSSLSFTEREVEKEIINILKKYKNKIYFTKYFTLKGKKGVYSIDKISDSDIIVDNFIYFDSVFNDYEVVFINGTPGMYDDGYPLGTYSMLNSLDNSKELYAGGGDALAAINKFKMNEKFKFISTGGGATLEYLTHGKCIGLNIK